MSTPLLTCSVLYTLVGLRVYVSLRSSAFLVSNSKRASKIVLRAFSKAMDDVLCAATGVGSTVASLPFDVTQLSKNTANVKLTTLPLMPNGS